MRILAYGLNLNDMANQDPSSFPKNYFFNQKSFTDYLISELRALSVVFHDFEAYQ